MADIVEHEPTHQQQLEQLAVQLLDITSESQVGIATLALSEYVESIAKDFGIIPDQQDVDTVVFYMGAHHIAQQAARNRVRRHNLFSEG